MHILIDLLYPCFSPWIKKCIITHLLFSTYVNIFVSALAALSRAQKSVNVILSLSSFDIFVLWLIIVIIYVKFGLKLGHWIILFVYLWNQILILISGAVTCDVGHWRVAERQHETPTHQQAEGGAFHRVTVGMQTQRSGSQVHCQTPHFPREVPKFPFIIDQLFKYSFIPHFISAHPHHLKDFKAVLNYVNKLSTHIFCAISFSILTNSAYINHHDNK